MWWCLLKTCVMEVRSQRTHLKHQISTSSCEGERWMSFADIYIFRVSTSTDAFIPTRSPIKSAFISGLHHFYIQRSRSLLAYTYLEWAPAAHTSVCICTCIHTYPFVNRERFHVWSSLFLAYRRRGHLLTYTYSEWEPAAHAFVATWSLSVLIHLYTVWGRLQKWTPAVCGHLYNVCW